MQILAYLLARFSEPSSYAGLGAVLALLGWNLPDPALAQLVQALAAGCGLLALLLKDRGVLRSLVLVAALGGALTLSACKVADVDRGKIAVFDELEAACAVAMSLAPISRELRPWIEGGCGTATAVARLAEDPGSLGWVLDLVHKARALAS